MRHHHRFCAGRDAVDERNQIGATQIIERARIDRGIEMGVLGNRTMPREMLECRGHAGQAHAAQIGLAEFGRDLRIGIECAFADRAIAASEIDDRRETHVHPDRAHLAGHQPRVLLGPRDRGAWIVCVQLADARERRQAREAVAKTLDRAAFLIDTDEEWLGALGADVVDQRGDLVAIFEVAREQDHAADLPRRQARAVCIAQCFSG